VHENHSPDTRLAVAANDIAWIKQSLKEIKEKQEELSDQIRAQNDRASEFATKSDIEQLSKDVQDLQRWRSWLTGAYLVGAGIIGALFEYGRQWLTGGGGK